jgi:cephalosporin hydroxylase
LGSGEGGSALWFADHSELLDLNAQVYSFDLNPPPGVAHSGVTFVEADIQNLASSVLGSVLEKCGHPILIVEDGPHTYEASRAALEFCDPYLKSGDYFVVEDGIVRELGLEEYQDGPRRAVQDFLASRPNTYRVNRDYCDYFGTNMTWNPDGYLTKI